MTTATDTGFEVYVPEGIDRDVITEIELLRLLLDRIEALQTAEEVTDLSNLFLYVARADRFEGRGYYNDMFLLALAGSYRFFLGKVGDLALALPRDEGQALRTLVFNSARFFGGFLNEHNFK